MYAYLLSLQQGEEKPSDVIVTGLVFKAVSFHNCVNYLLAQCPAFWVGEVCVSQLLRFAISQRCFSAAVSSQAH